MEFEIARKDFITPLKMLTGVVDQRQTMPILANILVAAADGQLQMTATDSEVEIQCRVPVDSLTTGGTTTIPARKLFDICRNLTDTHPIRIKQEESRATLQAGRSRFLLSCLPADDFPSSLELQSSLQLTLNRDLFKSLLLHTQYAMAQQDVRYYLNGILMDFKSDKLVVVATDGHRLALAHSTMHLPDAAPSQIIIPRKAVLEISRMLDTADEEVRLEIDQHHIKIHFSAELTLISKLIDGRFPEYQAVLPANNDKTMSVNCELLKQALSRAAVLSNEKYKGVRMNMDAGLLRLSTHNTEQDEAEEELEIAYEGDGLEIGFNVSYLLDAINAIPTDEVVLQFSDPNSSCLIQPKEIETVRYVIMPMRL